ncbi:NUDIX domain-containing protein [Jeotgalibacillus terrae]|uniref:NUDIX domain-containing protein n=1 Tax=Jeotgalibacillus terrae TaxID=587735 RepID=A0ABW5ZEC0_9BACL|nr:NUDIX hydrolase [Jeotgalibacillus terrae]MBM7580539.1 ADP-ribose pyrophosphatase YjhB (NUDIX family) [Jeotgalibacillus terrae]
MKRGKVWLGAAGVIENSKGEWLVVKKKYGGLKGMWSIPAGFVEEGETADQAAVREVKEETGITAEVIKVAGFRSGVLKDTVSDNMIIFVMKAVNEEEVLQVPEEEIAEAAWIDKGELRDHPDVSSMIPVMIDHEEAATLEINRHSNPGDQFGYTKYHLFF